MRIRTGLVSGMGVVTAAGLLAAAAGATPPGTDQGRPSAASRALKTSLTPASRIAVLLNGDRVQVGSTATGAPTLTFLGTPREKIQAVRAGSAMYVIPKSLTAVVGSTWDLALFDVTAARPGGRTAVTITYAADSAPTAVPGVEVTSRSGRTAYGYVTTASSRALGAALATTDAESLFAGVRSIVPTGKAAPRTDSRWPMHTVEVRAVGFDGKPAGRQLIFVVNTTDPSKGLGVVFTNYKGVGKVSIPEGTYQLIDSGFATRRGIETGYLVPSPEFIVSGPRSATVDLRTATSPVSSSNPWGEAAFAMTALDRTITSDSISSNVGSILFAAGDTPIVAAPTVGPLHGEQSIIRFDNWQTTGAVAKRYDLYGKASGRIGSRVKFSFTNANTMAINSSFYGPSDLSTSLFSVTMSDASGGVGAGMPAPGPRLERRVSAVPGTYQEGEFIQSLDLETFAPAGWFRSFPKPAKAGGTLNESWGKAPLHLRFLRPDLSSQDLPCGACVAGAILNVITLPMSDNDPMHIGNLDPVGMEMRGSYVLKADNKVIASGNGYSYNPAELPLGTKVVSGTQTGVRDGGIFALATSLTTQFATPLAAAFPAPASENCDLGDACKVVPFLSATYSAKVDPTNRLSAGKQSIGVTVQQVGRATPKGVTSVKAWVSYNGTTWVAAPVTGSAGTYAASVTVPSSAGRSASLKIAVTDQAGSTLTETIRGAFLLPR